MVEEWRDIVGAGGDYQVSNLGRIRKWGKVSTAVLVCMVHGRLRKIPHLVLEAFVGPRPEGMECCHYDDNPRNNLLTNLRWDTHVGNMDDARRNGYKYLGGDVRTRHGGEENGAAVLKNITANEIRELRRADSKTWSYSALAKKFNIGRTTVRHIIANETYVC